MSNRALIFPPCTDGSRLGLGGAPLGNLFRALSDEEAAAVTATAWESGCRSFDSAPHYGHGLSEHRVGRAVRGVSRGDVAVSSKVGRLLKPNATANRAQHGYIDILPFDQCWDFGARGIRRSIEDSLQRLGLARLDAVFVHDCDRDSHAASYPAVLEQVVGEAIPELRRMQHEGLIGAIGLGVNAVAVCEDVLARVDLDCLLLAGRYSLLDQSALPALLPLCQARGVRIAIGGVFNSGILATGVRSGGAPPLFNYGPASRDWIERAGRVENICDRYGVPLRAAALQFPLAHPAVEIVLVGAHEASQWTDALEMMRHSIPSAFWQALLREHLLPSAAPLPEVA